MSIIIFYSIIVISRLKLFYRNRECAAIAVLQKMDESQAAKVLAALDPGQSARLTRSIYSGKRSSMVSPGDQMEPMTPSAE